MAPSTATTPSTLRGGGISTTVPGMGPPGPTPTASAKSVRSVPRMDEVIEGSSPSANRGRKRKASPVLDSVNARIGRLARPSRPVNVALAYANSDDTHALMGNVQAYAKVAGPDWTYYVQKLEVLIGREPEPSTAASNGPSAPPPPSAPTVDIDLGPSKIVSRRHAVIGYDLQARRWICTVVGRNGIKVDSATFKEGTRAIIEIGGVEMMFVLPESPDATAAVDEGATEHKALGGASVAGGGLSTVNSSPVHGNSASSLYDSDFTVVRYTFEQLARDEHREVKPPFSYATMIAQAILSVPEQKMTLANIYKWVSDHYAYYRHAKTGWQNSIRHNLSLNKAFEKVPREDDDPGKGMNWRIGPEYVNDYMARAHMVKGGNAAARAEDMVTQSSPRSSVSPGTPSGKRRVSNAPGSTAAAATDNVSNGRHAPLTPTNSHSSSRFAAVPPATAAGRGVEFLEPSLPIPASAAHRNSLSDSLPPPSVMQQRQPPLMQGMPQSSSSAIPQQHRMVLQGSPVDKSRPGPLYEHTPDRNGGLAYTPFMPHTQSSGATVSPARSSQLYPLSSPAPYWRYSNFTPLKDYSSGSGGASAGGGAGGGGQSLFSSPIRPPLVSHASSGSEKAREDGGDRTPGTPAAAAAAAAASTEGESSISEHSKGEVSDLKGVDLAKGFEGIEWKNRQ